MQESVDLLTSISQTETEAVDWVILGPYQRAVWIGTGLAAAETSAEGLNPACPRPSCPLPFGGPPSLGLHPPWHPLLYSP